MAMGCIYGGRECDGCMRCQKEPRSIGACSACGEPITTDDEFYYNIEGELVHDDCLREWAEKYRIRGGA